MGFLQRDSSTNTKKRNGYIDLFRSMGIILMVMDHIYFGKVFSYFIHAFHMPMFFFISGYFFHGDEKISNFVKNKAKRLLIPYFAFGIFHYIIWFFIKDTDEPKQLISLFWINTEDTLPVCNAIWFLTSLFIVSTGYYCLSRLIIWGGRLKGSLTIFICVIAILGNCSKVIIHGRLPWAMDTAMVGMGFYHAGYIVRTYSKTCFGIIQKLNFSKLVVLGILTEGIIFVNGYVNMRTQTYAVIPLFWINAFLAIFVGLALCYQIESGYGENRLIYIVKDIGENSVTYLCLNQLIIFLCNRINGIIGIPNGLLTLIIVIFSIHIINNIITNTKLKFILGR